jgi:tRNA G10  N-methylase Trm11
MEITRSKNGLRKECCEFFLTDFRSLMDYISQGTVDAIVTDPPWGIYKTGFSLQILYNDMIEVFSKVIKHSGSVVILSAAEKEIRFALENNPAFTLREEIPILVSGKKTNVFHLIRQLNNQWIHSEDRYNNPSQSS